MSTRSSASPAATGSAESLSAESPSAEPPGADSAPLSAAPPGSAESPSAALPKSAPGVAGAALLPLAERDQRLAAAITDGLLLLGTTLFCLTVWVELTGFKPSSPLHLQAALVACGLPFSVVQWVLIARRGQTVGKIRLKIRIERLDGAPVGFFRGVLLRTWVVLAVSLVFAFVRLIDCLFIYRADRRCLHDLLAGTRVVRLTPADDTVS